VIAKKHQYAFLGPKSNGMVIVNKANISIK